VTEPKIGILKKKMAALDQALAEGLDAEAQGRVLSLEDVAAQVKAKIKAVRTGAETSEKSRR